MTRINRTDAAPVGASWQPHVGDREWNRISLAFRFTERENQIVRNLLRGHDGAAIARCLGISRHTVHTHFDRIYRKLGISNRSQLLLRIFAEYVRIS